jgi:hypothetical protein
MTGPMVKLRATEDGVVHWTYLMAGRLTVCGILGERMRDEPRIDAPTCFCYIALVQADKQGDSLLWLPQDPTRKLG